VARSCGGARPQSTTLVRVLSAQGPAEPSAVRAVRHDPAVALERFHDFFVASAGVAGALIGLLFVAISVAPDRLLADDAAQAHRVRASAALTAFSNALSVSLFALVPDISLGWTALIVGILGLMFVAGSLVSLLRARHREPSALRDAGFLAGLVVVFVLQIRFGIRLTADEGDSGATSALCVLVIVCFLIGISRAWELIGGPSIGLRSQVAAVLRERHEER